MGDCFESAATPLQKIKDKRKVRERERCMCFFSLHLFVPGKQQKLK